MIATKGSKINGHLVLDGQSASKAGVLTRHELPKGSRNLVISGDGKFVAITGNDSFVSLFATKDLLAGKPAVPVEVGGTSVDAAFTGKHLYVTVHQPDQVVRISLADNTVKTTHKLDFPAGKIFIPEADMGMPNDKYAVVTNHSPLGRYTRLGPQTSLSAHLLDISEDKIQGIYDAYIPQSTRLSAVGMSTANNKAVYRYKIGTDPRSGNVSPYKTIGGKERIVRDGKRVHVYATVIRSHITPDYIEVEQGDIVTVHLTSNEQSKDQTHGFTIDSYNVHGSFEPGKTASVTFVADRAGSFRFTVPSSVRHYTWKCRAIC